ncbi:serine carboxypeptidase-like 7 isoform X2 [Olea europaea var. sylvestris]|uniref:serine carboxypeptidase-like 7 isoform X2 n=1 Tax=Olea europaea var. sylvestris TaxID=158386 RepID=UPI000C1CF94D|nr:serine carboxypeptidase-like 7 isoform X2 [Olea europaea var. sylvestris]
MPFSNNTVKHTCFCSSISRLIIMKLIWFDALLLLLLLQLLFSKAASEFNIETLPGYSGTLPVKLETGYIDVGETEEVQIFYYFIESEGNPKTDPILLWLTGGPGCSALSGLFYEIGPLAFDDVDFDGSLPSIHQNPYSWTKVANIIFIDWPVGTGFSYANTSKGYSSSDTKSAKDNYTFLRKWLSNHPMFMKNRLYIAGDSYGGKLVPMVALEILKGNEAGFHPRIFLQGYIIGNGVTDPNIDYNERIPYAHRMALIPDEYFESAKISCDGKYYNPDPKNLQCLYALRPIQESIKNVNGGHILEPKCKIIAPKPDELGWDQTLVEDDSIDHLFLPSKIDGLWCRPQTYATSYIWANDPIVQEALHIKKGTITDWTRCNHSLSYEHNIESVVQYHKILSRKGYEALVYSGDHDMGVPYMGTLKWIRGLNLTIDDEWRPWNVNGQVAGYTRKYKKNDFYLTFVTVKGAGHTAPEYNPEQCLAMLDRWLSLYPL